MAGKTQKKYKKDKRKNFIREKKIYCGKEWLEVDIVPVTNMPEAGKKKTGITSQKQQNLNDKRSKRRFVQTAHTNFGHGDCHISLTYNNAHLPSSLKEAEKTVHNYLNRVRRRMKKVTGKELKWMLVTEYTPEEGEGQQMVLGGMEDKRTKPVRVHHHIILSGGLSRDELELLWSTTRINWNKVQDAGYCRTVDMIGFINCDRLQPDENGLEGLTNYINKRKKSARKWSTSQNLEKPKEKKNDYKYSFKKLREMAKTPEDKETWRRQYQGYEPVKIDYQYSIYTGWSVYLRLHKLPGSKCG